MEDGRLVGFASYFPPEKHYTEWDHYYTESFDNGKTWSSLTPVEMPNKHTSLGKQLVLQNGECIYPVTFFEKRPKALKGPVAELVKCETELEALEVPPSVSDKDVKPWKFGEYLHGVSILKAENEESLDFKHYGRIANRPLGLLEPMGIQLKDGSIALLMRAEYAGFLWRSDSYDNGETWSPAYQTKIPNPSSLISVIRLPDERIALIHNPSGEVGQFSPRTPLSLWISDDEMKTWSFKADFFTSQDWFAYPNAIIFRDQLVFAYDKNRREVKFIKVNLTNTNK
jgi:predicted neuraminidase